MNILKNTMLISLKIVTLLILAVPVLSTAAEEGDVARGSKAWANNCSRCHNMRDPKEFRDDGWRPIIAHMRLRAGLSGQQARDILTFLQSSNYTAPASSGSMTKVAESSGEDGETIYNNTCIACHGADGQGALPGVPKFSERLSKPDDVLLSNITNGFQSKGSPMAMPPKGGNPNLSDADIMNVLSYIRENLGK
mgnify:CR=1 FL=1|jgi:mono/diheme cytochrome c family protein